MNLKERISIYLKNNTLILARDVLIFLASVGGFYYQVVRLDNAMGLLLVEQNLNADFKTENKELTKMIEVLVANQVSNSGLIEQTDLIFWIKELHEGEYKMIYLSPAYDSYLPAGLNRMNLLGRNFKIVDVEFGEIYQKNDFKSLELKEPKVYIEPYRLNGVEPVLMGKFLKGRVWKRKDKTWVFGLFIENVK